MPTMAKLFAAFLMGALGYFAGDAVANHFPPEESPGVVRIVAALFGALIGWRFLGKRAGRGWNAAAGVGLSAGVLLVLSCLLWFSGEEMVQRAMRLAYGGNPIAALEDMFQIAFELIVEKLAYMDVGLILVLGSMACGVVTEAVARRWS